MSFFIKLWAWIRYLMTDANDEWDATLLIWFASIGIFLYKAAVSPTPFDFTGYGVGAAGIFAAGKALDWFTHRKDKDVRTQHD